VPEDGRRRERHSRGGGLPHPESSFSSVQWLELRGNALTCAPLSQEAMARVDTYNGPTATCSDCEAGNAGPVGGACAPCAAGFFHFILKTPDLFSFFGLWRVRFPPCLVRPGRRLPVQGLSEGSLGFRDRLPAWRGPGTGLKLCHQGYQKSKRNLVYGIWSQ